MGVDVVDVVGRHIGAAQRRLHAAIGSIAVLRRRGDVERIAGHTVTDEFPVNPGAAAFRMLVFFEHHGAGALPHDEAVAIPVIWPRRALGRLVESGRQRAAGGKAGKRQPVDRRFRPTRDHDVGVAQRHEPSGVADGVRAGRTRGDHGMIGALKRMGDRDVTRCQVDDAAGNEERRNAPRPAVAQL